MKAISRFPDRDLKFPEQGNFSSGPDKSGIGKPEFAIPISDQGLPGSTFTILFARQAFIRVLHIKYNAYSHFTFHLLDRTIGFLSNCPDFQHRSGLRYQTRHQNHQKQKLS